MRNTLKSGHCLVACEQPQSWEEFQYTEERENGVIMTLMYLPPPVREFVKELPMAYRYQRMSQYDIVSLSTDGTSLSVMSAVVPSARQSLQ